MRLPRRLVYVVNRRTVVDQSTDQVERIRERLLGKGELSQQDRTVLENLRGRLALLCPAQHGEVLAISTLRGQYADNQEWSADPSRPAVICGTVDMIGSRLLFAGYRIGFKSRPLHAGFLGQDALLVHDEAHLEPAFQRLLERIVQEQEHGERTGMLPWPKLRVIALSATARNGSHQTAPPFGLTPNDYRHPVVQRRVEASKALHLHPCDNEKRRLADQIVQLALKHKDSGDAILVFVRGVEDALSALSRLDLACPDHVVSLTGTMRGRERDELVRSAVYTRFMPTSDRPDGVSPTEGAVYLVCTSAGEVGVNLSADHLVCDLSTLDSMAQRLGRVNRFGDRKDARVDVVYPETFDAKKPNPQRQATLALLKQLPPREKGSWDACPKALGSLWTRTDLPCTIDEAFSPTPTMLEATDILFDAWALTTIREAMPGRPPVAPFLHGLTDWEPPEAFVAWRDEVGIVTDELLNRYDPQDLLDNYPLRPHELLRDRSDRVFDQLQVLARRCPNSPVWLLNEQGQVAPSNLAEVADPSATQAAARQPLIARIEGCTILLSPSAGGLNRGMLDGESPHANDVADIPAPATERRIRLWSDDAERDGQATGMQLVQSIELVDDSDDTEVRRTWDWYKCQPLEDTRTSRLPVRWETHVTDAVARIEPILAGLSLPGEIAQAVRLAVRLHDHGKRRPQFQFALGNRDYPALVLAKSGRVGAWLPETYRHEFGSLADALQDEEFRQLSPEWQDLVLHLIAAHHGRARPHFPREEAFDPAADKAVPDAVLAGEVPRRFARLQRKYGRWGLACLESLLRAADWAASAEPSEYVHPATEVSR